MPADFATTMQAAYPKATMPNPLPTAVATTPQVAVPNVLGAGSSLPQIAHSLISQAGLTAQDDGPMQITGVDGQLMDGQVIGQNPAAGTMVAQGSVVTLHIGNYHPHPAFISLGHAHPPA
jgi:beta-lactam-binding protein with PASTA domain